MKVEIRIYKQYDTDLVALADNGYPVCEMMRAALVGYANGDPVMFKLDEHLFFDMNRKKNVRLRLNISSSDKKTIDLLKHIKHGYRNTFCKMVLRDALSRQNLSCFYSDEETMSLQLQNAGVVSRREISSQALRLKRYVLPSADDYSVKEYTAPSSEHFSTLSAASSPPVYSTPVTTSRSVVEEKQSYTSPDTEINEVHNKKSPKDILAAFDAL